MPSAVVTTSWRTDGIYGTHNPSKCDSSVVASSTSYSAGMLILVYYTCMHTDRYQYSALVVMLSSPKGKDQQKKYLVLLKRWIGIRCHSPKKKATHTRVRYVSQMSNICTASVSLRTHTHHAQRNASPRPLHQGGQENPRSFLGAGIFLPGSMGFLTDAGDFRQAEGMLPPAWATPCSCLLQDLCIYVRR